MQYPVLGSPTLLCELGNLTNQDQNEEIRKKDQRT